MATPAPRHRRRSGARTLPGGFRRVVAAGSALAVLAAFAAAAGAAFSGAAQAGSGTSGSTPTTSTTTAPAAFKAVRLSGVDRYGTAAAVSAASFPNGAPVAFVATGADYPDALTAAAAAGGKGPVLLVTPTSLPDATAAELARLHPSAVTIVGGTLAVTPAVVTAVGATVPAARLARVAGADRYATAAALSRTVFTTGSSTAWVATGADYPDALTAAAAAGGHSPVLLVRSTSVPRATAAELARLAPTTINIVGGIGAVSSGVRGALETMFPTATVARISGSDRYATAAAVSDATFPHAPIAYLATGADYPDALSAAAVAGGNGPVLLVSASSVPAVTATELGRLGANDLVIVGGELAIPTAVASAAREVVATTLPPPPSAAAATAVSTARAQIGKPYLWGGAGPNSFDCSGLTMYAWRAAGVTLPHNSQSQYDMLPPVAIADLQPGDLVFYGTPTNVYHVGISIGGGQMIEAAHSGVPVRVAAIQRPDLLAGGRVTTTTT